MSMESELIKSLDEIAFEEGTGSIKKLESIQNLLYQYEQMMTYRSMQQSIEDSNEPNARRL
jgi:hypothetical protein